MQSVTAKQIQELDAIAIHIYGIPSLALMENAGRLVSQEVLGLCKRRMVTIVCGTGNNAGDGFVAARYLINADVPVQIILAGSGKALKHDALVNYKILKHLRIPIKEIQRVTPKVKAMIGESGVLVDALFGVGLNRDIESIYKDMIELINSTNKKVIAVDVPSGLDATTGRMWGVCVKAERTVTFTYPKKGFYIKDGPKHTGKVVIADIGIPEKIKQRIIK